MKATEVMIGDWVMGGEPFKIGEIDPDFAHWDEISPIPLTSEILKKNGFVGEGYQILSLDDGHWLEYYNHEHRLTRFWEGIDEWQNHSKVRDVVFRCHCHYVHELQHALKLCGINREIIL